MNPNLYSSVPRPFDAVAQILADLMEKRGFRVSRGTYHHGNGDTLPTWVITRPDYPEWQGLWQPWEMEPEYPEDAESQTLLEVCGTAIKTWDEVAWMYCDPNTPDESEAHCQRCGGCRMLPGTGPDDDLMNTPCPDCNEWAGKTVDLAAAQAAAKAAVDAMCRHHRQERLRAFVWDLSTGSIPAADIRRIATRLLNELRDAATTEATP